MPEGQGAAAADAAGEAEGWKSGAVTFNGARKLEGRKSGAAADRPGGMGGGKGLMRHSSAGKLYVCMWVRESVFVCVECMYERERAREREKECVQVCVSRQNEQGSGAIVDV